MEIIDLPKEKWKGTLVPLVTRSDSYYDFEIKQLDSEGCKIELIGFDTCCYTNDDIGRREVRINLGFFFNRDRKRWQESK